MIVFWNKKNEIYYPGFIIDLKANGFFATSILACKNTEGNWSFKLIISGWYKIIIRSL